jgi:sigma-B regulation protein RsbU (phosphoserine phosphatase)
VRRVVLHLPRSSPFRVAWRRIAGAGARPSTVTAVFRPRTVTSSETTTRIASEALNLFLIPFVVVGLAVLFLRVDSAAAWLLALLFASFATIPGGPGGFVAVPAATRPFCVAYQALMVSVVGPLFYWFFAVFPRRSPMDRRVPWLKWAGVLVGLVLAWPDIGSTGALTVPEPLGAAIGESLAGQIPFWFEFVFCLLGLVSLAWNRLTLRDADSRRRIRAVFWGTVLGVTPSLALTGARQFGLREPIWMAAVIDVFLLSVFPLSFAYAILRHRALDIPVLLRRGARYLLVLRGSLVLLALAAVALAALFASSLAHYLRPTRDLGLPLGLGMGTGFGGVLLWAGAGVQRRVRARIDRAFFRSAYDARVILEDLARRTARTTRREELARLLEGHLREALQPGSLAIFLRDSTGALSAARADGVALTLLADLPFLARLARHGGSWEAPPEGVGNGDGELPPALAALHPDCLVPVVDREGGLVGLLALGARLSEEPYSGEDKRLLASVASQAGIALDNIRLAEEIAERLEVERRATREMHIARDVQDRLLPQALPKLESLEVAARCIQARAVGGDFYDVLDLGRGRVGLALADVSGKGIPAALLMANLQAHLRGQLGLAPEDPVECLRRINRMLWSSTDPGRFATLFLGVYDDAARRLTYVNCGHNPPAWLRRDGSVAALGATATVIGAFEDWTCSADVVQLAPGDLLAIYSDGLTEATRGAEQFGEPRLIAALRAAAGSPVERIVEGTLQEVQSFCSAGSTDDLTLLIARVR